MGHGNSETFGAHEVVIAGAGPAGLMLAGELTLAGIDVAVIERRTSQDLVGSRAGGLHSRTIEVLDQRGIADRFLAEGAPAQVAGFALVHFDISGFPSRHPYGLTLWQKHFERILAGWVEELGAPILRGREVSGLRQDERGVEVRLADGGALKAQYLVGCDGGRSAVRKAAGIGFEGWDPTVSHLIAEVELAQEPEWGMRHDAIGTHGLGRLENGHTARVMVTEQRLDAEREPNLEDLRQAMVAVYGTDYGAHSPTSISRFTDMTRQAAAYRQGRVLLAGDAAHIHYPAGGQGLNTGVQDAVNLGWKLAQVVKGISPQSLLDTYHAERHPEGARVLRNTMAQVALRRTDPRTKALGEIMSELLNMREPRDTLAAMIANLDIRYDLGEGHPLLGRRMPDLDLITAGGPVRVYELLHRARPVLIGFGAPVDFDLAPWADRVEPVTARRDGRWELPLLGEVSAPRAVLVRPDGHAAWVGDGGVSGLAEALTAWFGPPSEGAAGQA